MSKPSDEGRCDLCGEPMPEGESMFKFHGYSGPCPKPPLSKPTPVDWQARAEKAEAVQAAAARSRELLRPYDDVFNRVFPQRGSSQSQALKKAEADLAAARALHHGLLPGYCTSTAISGDGGHAITIHYASREDMERAHGALCDAVDAALAGEKK